MSPNTYLLRCASVVALAAIQSGLASRGVADDQEKNHYAQFYGFSSVELYKSDKRSFGLTAGDFNSDGLTDLVTVDNRASCLRIFQQRESKEAREKKVGKYVNDLQSDWRFDIRQITVDKQVAGLVCKDLNNDGRLDVAYIGTPDRLVIRYQPENPKAEWSEKFSVRLPELAPAAWMIAAGDLNGDQLSDIAVLGKNVTYLVYQNDKGTMEAPERLINTSAQLSLLAVADINGDAKMDLTYQASDGASRGLCARLQTADGRLGPEVRFDLQQPRSVTLYDVDQQPGSEILTVDGRTGRVLVSRLEEMKRTEDSVSSRMLQFGIGDASGAKGRALAVGDIDGDKLNDVIVTDPENAQVLVYRQNGIDGLDTVETYPGLLGASDICTVDTNGDGKMEVVMMSATESAVAISSFEDGRLTFPKTVAKPIDGYDLMAIETLRDKNGARLAVFQRKGSGSSAKVELQFLQVSKKATWEEASKQRSLTAGAVGTRGVSLLPFDADGDDMMDLLVVPNGAGNKGVLVVKTKADKESTSKPAPLNLGISSAGALFVDGADLLVARDAFARKMSLADDKWTVADQFNAAESKAKITGVAVLNLDGTEGDEVCLIDSGIKKVRIFRSRNGLYKPWKEVELGSLRFNSSHVADMDGDGDDDLVLFGQQQFSVLYSGRVDSSLEEVATWESTRDDAYPADVIAGDINGDGKIDLAVIDTSIDGVQLLHFDAEAGLDDATHFSVFEEKRLVTTANTRGTEPREGTIVDVTNDGRADLVILCHDRLIVYPQDTAVEPTSTEAAGE